MLEIIVVVGIVAVAAAVAGRSFYRTMTGKNVGCRCGCSCQGCACKDFAETYRGKDPDK